jgi:hypothetical protein
MTIKRFSELVNGVINSAIGLSSNTMTGLIASPPYQVAGGYNADLGDAGGAMWVVDVDIGAADGQPLSAVPIATNNRDIFYADAGKAVTLQRSYNGQWVVVGLSKTALDMTDITYMSFTDDIATVVRRVVPTLRRRPLTWGELGTLHHFGQTPLGAWGVFDNDGNFLELVET